LPSKQPYQRQYSEISAPRRETPKREKRVMTPRPPAQASKMPASASKGNWEECNELRRKNLCFTCKAPWVPGHRCQGKGQIHYIEVISEVEESDDEYVSSDDKDPEDQE